MKNTNNNSVDMSYQTAYAKSVEALQKYLAKRLKEVFLLTNYLTVSQFWLVNIVEDGKIVMERPVPSCGITQANRNSKYKNRLLNKILFPCKTSHHR